MSALFILVPLSLLMGGVATATFLWALRSGQFDDLQSPATKLILDEDQPNNIPSSQSFNGEDNNHE